MFTLIVTFLDTPSVRQYDDVTIAKAHQLIDELQRQQRYFAWSIMDEDNNPVDEMEQ